MKRRAGLTLAVFAAAIVALAMPGASIAQQKKLVMWTHWDQNPDFNKWYADKGKEFAKKSGYEVEVVTVPYQGYDAKYLAAFMAKNNAPDIFMGMTHHWCGQYDFCDRMPDDLAKPTSRISRSTWATSANGRACATAFRSSTATSSRCTSTSTCSRRPASIRTSRRRSSREWLAAMKKLTIADPKGGEPTQVGFAIRSKGPPVGITDKFLPFAHAWGARMLSPDLAKAAGYANSPEMIAALTFFGDLVNKDKVASLAFGNPEDAFGQKRAAVIFRESWFFGWLKKNAPDVNFKVYALPCEKTCPGAGALFPWTDLVYKGSPNKPVAWEFMRFISNAKDDMEHHQIQGILPVWTANLETDYVKIRPDYQSTRAMLAQPVPPAYFHPKSNELATAFGEAVVGVLFGKGQPKPLLDDAAAKMDRILKD